ncbi:hypothetical protein [Candidatus Nitrotoga arctica]|uniref:Cell division protein ZapA n=1 Tax=Candidatus Nitrotoga arctica TaxID=453162 RepID=A0ABN8AML7_9PROT|nr:hypothetical protein [Candidatus Nitrotoga arctica]CAG9932426.1 conserved protein of unknown function [Candidatus Nitrotoga arctica]
MLKPKRELTINKDESVILNHDRVTICLGAAYELDALAKLLPDVVEGNDKMEHLVVRGIASRIKSLSELLMSGLDEEVKTNAHLTRILRVTD